MQGIIPPMDLHFFALHGSRFAAPWVYHPSESGCRSRVCHSTPSALNTASSALWYGINWNALIKSDGTAIKSVIDAAGSRTFFAPLSRHTCRVFASSSTLISVPLILLPFAVKKLNAALLDSFASRSVPIPVLSDLPFSGQQWYLSAPHPGAQNYLPKFALRFALPAQ